MGTQRPDCGVPVHSALLHDSLDGSRVNALFILIGLAKHKQDAIAARAVDGLSQLPVVANLLSPVQNRAPRTRNPERIGHNSH